METQTKIFFIKRGDTPRISRIIGLSERQTYNIIRNPNHHRHNEVMKYLKTE